ncbi:MAG: limonene-1,2-epoxide hydrolase family protein [Pseudomonadota bacterium]
MNENDIVTAFLKAFEKKDYDTALKFVSPNCSYVNPPPLGTVIGAEGIRSVLEPFFAPVLKNDFVIRNQATAGNVTFIERLDRHQLPGKWIELPVTGVFEVNEGLITYWRDYFDLATLMAEWTQP